MRDNIGGPKEKPCRQKWSSEHILTYILPIDEPKASPVGKDERIFRINISIDTTRSQSKKKKAHRLEARSTATVAALKTQRAVAAAKQRITVTDVVASDLSKNISQCRRQRPNRARTQGAHDFRRSNAWCP